MYRIINNKTTNKKWFLAIGFLGFILLTVYYLLPTNYAEASVISLSPSSGTYEVGDTFDVEILVDTEGATVNTIWALLNFPPNSLQVVSPSTGKSVVGIWTKAPRFDNSRGSMELQGVIPGGINTRSGLVTTVTFRVKRPGIAFFQFLDDSVILLHDGQGTPSLRQAINATYKLVLPPPQGPDVASSTHPEQDKWYRNDSVSLEWPIEEKIEGYSYTLDQEPTTNPDDISEGVIGGITYTKPGDGTYFFHIKALREGKWGGITHFAINIDSIPPAGFNIDIAPSNRTFITRPIISFVTTDGLSGISRYELKIISLDAEGSQAGFFIETVSPYSVEFSKGNYDIIVRAYDTAGNVKESTERLTITTRLFKIISSKGIEIKGVLIIPWWLIFILLFLILAILGVTGWYIYKRHKEVEEKVSSNELPLDLQKQLKDLQEYRKKYGKIAVILFIAMSTMFLRAPVSLAQEQNNVSSEDVLVKQVSLAPPSITTVSRDISNEDIFYVGGYVNVFDAEVVLLLQNMTTGETISRIVKTDETGEWFYRHNSFLTAGKYLIWAQSSIGEQMSPPSPQIQITVNTTALQFGSSRISYASLFLILAIALLILNAGLAVFIWHHRKYAKKKHSRFMKEIKEAEESIRRGFAVLRRDIQAELDTVKKAKVGKELSQELKQRENELLGDLETIEQKIGKEIWDVERSEHKD